MNPLVALSTPVTQESPYVVAVILAHNQRDRMLRVVEAVKQQSRPPSRIVVVDNGSEDGACAALAHTHPDVECIALAANIGVGAGHNLGWRAALAEPPCTHIWALEHDCVPQPTCLEQLLDAARELWSAGQPVGVVIPFQENPATLSAQPHLAVRGLRFIRVLQLAPGAPPQSRRYLTFNGALLPVDLVCAVGFLNEAFFVYCEDIDFSLRCHQAKRSIYLIPAARVEHDVFRDSLRWSLGRWVILGPGRAGLLRVYYGFRNHLALALRTSRPQGWIILRHVLAYLLLQLWDLCVATDRTRRLRLRTLALRDGLAGRLGRADYPLFTRRGGATPSSSASVREVRPS